MGARALALWCAVVVAVGAAAAYTVDCNHEYTDCDTEMIKIISEDEETPNVKAETITPITTTIEPTRSTPKIEISRNDTEEITTTEASHTIEALKPRPRLINLNEAELQNFANALHNQTTSKKKDVPDLSDVNLDDEEEEPPRTNENSKSIPDKFYSNLQAPFHQMMAPERGSEEVETCKDSEVSYKVGEKLIRGCEEACECTTGGIFDCSPRCKHPYIRRGRRLNDPLCFESPVDECCSIIACATGNGDGKTVLEVCHFGNDTYPVGAKWYIGCEQTCSCDTRSVITCKPRCKPIVPSEKCINVQDPNDACCEVQICDVSQDVHELTDNATTTTTTTSTTTVPNSITLEEFESLNEGRSSSRPLVLTEPIGSVKVLQNNSVQVNLMHLNNTEDPIHLLLSSDGGKTFEDVELKYSNLILNLDGGKDYILKTKETGTKFNFTITASDNRANEVPIEDSRNATNGCWQNGMFYDVGEEFHIGCSELCECTGPNTKECAALVCPNHVGLELMSKGCVRWAPSPPAQPPNCCPRSARCLSDGTCHYNGVPVPNWTEVPITLTGCEQRCFCENGELDCQEVCSPLPPVPPQTMRCPPLHRPAPVNISDEDCCKQWGCVPSAENHGSPYQKYRMPVLGEPTNYVTLPPISSIKTQVLPTPQADSVDFYKHLSPVKSFPKLLKTITPVPVTSVTKHTNDYAPGDNITVFTLDDVDAPFKTIHPEPPLMAFHRQWALPNPKPEQLHLSKTPKHYTSVSHVSHSHPEKHINLAFKDSKKHKEFPQTQDTPHPHSNYYQQEVKPQPQPFPQKPFAPVHDSMRKIPMSSIDNLDLFLPSNDKKIYSEFHKPLFSENSHIAVSEPTKISFFQPIFENKTNYLFKTSLSSNTQLGNSIRDHTQHSSLEKHVTVLKSKDINRPTTKMYDEDHLWSQDSKTHVLYKHPNPYETVLRRVVSNPKKSPIPKSNPLVFQKINSAIDLENLLSQMEGDSGVTRNLGRSADKNQEAMIGHGQSDNPHKLQPPPFLPTVPPELQFPEDENPNYDQNNIHRPDGGIPGLPPGFPPGLQGPPSFGDMNKKLSVISVESDSPTSVTMLLGLPSVLVGLRGSVDLRYTDTAEEDVSRWYSQVFAPADEILTTPRLEFRLTGLKPSTTYKIRGKLFLHNLPVAPASEVYSVKTLDLPVTEEKRREIDSRLVVMDVNDTSAHVSWRHFTEDELQFIDGIQVRYRPVGTPIYSMTELLHHSRSAAELHDLRPGSRYEASLVLVPPPRATTELNDPGIVEFTTAPYNDPYNWSVTIETRTVGSEAVSLTWSGVPSPAERWVRVYRAAHACGDLPAAREHDLFKLAARDQMPTVVLNGLESNSRCRVWLELFLTNGKVKTSNVLEVHTKSLDTDNPIDNEISASSISSGNSRSRGDYYSALVGVGVVAALGALTSMLLLLVVVRRHRPRSANITPVPSAPRESSLPPYDNNPAYKLELQQETMDL